MIVILYKSILEIFCGKKNEKLKYDGLLSVTWIKHNMNVSNSLTFMPTFPSMYHSHKFIRCFELEMYAYMEIYLHGCVGLLN